MTQLGRRSRHFVLIAMLVLTVAALAQAPSGTSIPGLNGQVVALNQAGRYGEALPIAQRVLALAEQLRGPDHPEVATCLNNLAELYRALGRYADAEPLYKRARAIWEKAFGADDIDVGTALNNLALLYKAEGRLVEAEPLYRRALAIWEKELGPDDLETGRALSNLGELYRAQGRYAEAESLYKRSIEIREKALGPDHAAVATALNNLGLLKSVLGRYAEAEPLLKRALAIWESSLGLDHPYVGTAMDNLAEVYWAEGRYAEAEPLYKRSLAIRELAVGPDHPYEATTYNNLALLYRTQDRPSDAEALFKRALAIREKALGPDHPDVAASLNNLAEFYRDQGKLSAAEPLYIRALAIRLQALGGDHADVATSLNNLANLYLERGEYAKAEGYYRQALAIRQKALGPDHPDVVAVLNNLAWLAFEQSRWSEAVDHWRQSTDVFIVRTRRGSDTVGKGLTGKTRSDSEREAFSFAGLVKAAYHLGNAEPSAMDQLGREMFKTIQWAHISDAAGSLAEMAAHTSPDDALARLVRERQDLVDEWYGKEAMLIATHSEAQSDATAEREIATRLAAIDARLREIDGALAGDFPSYAAFAQPGALAIEQVQDLLNPDEALVLLLDTPERKPIAEETFVWVVTKTSVRWVRSDLGAPSLAREVAALRCGLDYDGTWGAAGSRCSELLATTFTESDRTQGKPLPFDRKRAYALYAALFGQVEREIKDKHLLIVASGALTQLPFQVLITQEPVAAQSGFEMFRRAAWLVRSHALTVLPSVSSLRVLRQMAKASHADRPLIGFGDPLLDGPDASYAGWASTARSKQSCPNKPALPVAALSVKRGGVLPPSLHGGVADVSQIRAQVPLPETTDELCAVARALGASGDEIRLGERATEAEIKRLNAAGELSKYRVLHFATHAALAGLGSSSEPGLLLTPPSSASELDDGYLSASEIAALNLDADWVILSACNTAAGGVEGGEPLSGLARAFFYAGSRALLVSHWVADSEASVKLITKTLNTMADDKTVGRSEALRRSVLALIENGEPHQAHPATWAPFVVVGEGSSWSTSLTTSSIVPDPQKQRLKAQVQVPPKKKQVFEDWQSQIWRQ